MKVALGRCSWCGRKLWDVPAIAYSYVACSGCQDYPERCTCIITPEEAERRQLLNKTEIKQS